MRTVGPGENQRQSKYRFLRVDHRGTNNHIGDPITVHVSRPTDRLTKVLVDHIPNKRVQGRTVGAGENYCLPFIISERTIELISSNDYIIIIVTVHIAQPTHRST